MFKSWKSEKNKIKVVFRLQFQATQVPQLTGTALMISLVPANVGKPTVRLPKAAILEGICSWGDPVYETGSLRAGFVGKVSVDFADYAEATTPLTVSLPLNNFSSGIILHDELLNQITSHDAGSDSNSRDHWLEMTPARQDFMTLRRNSMPQKKTVDIILTQEHLHRRSNTAMSVGSVSDGSIGGLTSSPEENIPRSGLPESDSSTEVLRSEITLLRRQAEMTELELQSLRKQIVKESKRGQDLSRTSVSLKEERDALRTECERLKSSQKCIDYAEISNQEQPENENLKMLLEEKLQELKHEKALSKRLRSKLHRTEDSNSELILAVKDLEQMLKQKGIEILYLSSKIKAGEAAVDAYGCKIGHDKDEQAQEELPKNRDLCSEVDVSTKYEEEVNMQREQLVQDYEVLKQENHDIASKLEQNNIEQMKIKKEYLESLASIKELRLQVGRLEEEIKKQAMEFSASLDTINELETQVKGLEKELEKQAHNFEDDLEALMQTKVEQEQRAIRAEEALRKTKLSNANAAERLQEDFSRLSLELASKFDEKEKLAMTAVAEANNLRRQKSFLEGMLQKANEEFELKKDQYEGSVRELLNQTDLQGKRIEQMSLQLDEKRTEVENLREVQEENRKVFSNEIQELKVDSERLNKKTNSNTEEAEQKEKWMAKLEEFKERPQLETKLASATEEVSQENSTAVRAVKIETGKIVESLESEVETLRLQHNELKHRLLEIDLEKENLRKKVFILEGNLQQKDVTITSLQTKLQSESNRDTHSIDDESAPIHYRDKNAVSLTEKLRSLEEDRPARGVSLTASKHEGSRKIRENASNQEMTTEEGMLKQYESVKVPVERETETMTEEELRMPIFGTNDSCDFTKLVSEVASLQARNNQMDSELKEMQEKYSEISLKFAEVEGERQQLVMMIRNLKNGKTR
ncbi:hypothetical protein RJ639_004825 [Escallonia herrerae]|uniref:C2 NT-type domain-containing protein n=1 Tax=Escallonia herrerae TaxID=1293975 RepID=A0AA88VY58_9ASTE|nr:hypothetical protein RJ639_004825 [Escallonia herrerae]